MSVDVPATRNERPTIWSSSASSAKSAPVEALGMERPFAPDRVVADNSLAAGAHDPLRKGERPGRVHAGMTRGAHGDYAVHVLKGRVVRHVDLQGEARPPHEEGAVVRERVPAELRRDLEGSAHPLPRPAIPRIRGGPRLIPDPRPDRLLHTVSPFVVPAGDGR